LALGLVTTTEAAIDPGWASVVAAHRLLQRIFIDPARRLTGADDNRLDLFVTNYRQSPQAPE
jgi:hypothetical protein